MTPNELADEIARDPSYCTVLDDGERALIAAALRWAETYCDRAARFDIWQAKMTLAEESYRSAREAAK